MASRTQISIAMAVYNGERFLRDQLESFVRQTRRPDELVVADDASTDRSVEIVRAFAAKAPFPVTLAVTERNLGIERNFDRAISRCAGDIIFTSDWDDVWYPDKLAWVERALDEFPEAGFAVCDADVVDEALRPLGRRLFENAHLTGLPCSAPTLVDGRGFRRIPCNGTCLAFRANLRSAILPLPTEAEFRKWAVYDYLIVNVILLSGIAKGILIAKPLVAYRQHPQEMIGARNRSLATMLKLGWITRQEHSSAPVMAALAARLAATPEPADQKAAALRRGAIAHFTARCSLPQRKFARLPVVAREVLTRRYGRFSSGVRSAVKDLAFVDLHAPLAGRTAQPIERAQ